MRIIFRTALLSAIGISAMTGIANVIDTGAAQAQRNIEQPKYDVVHENDGIQLRVYKPYIVAEVTVEANSRRQASRKGFMPLAGYIFGDNKRADKISMTAPVTTQAKNSSTKISMTAPVTTRNSGENIYIVRFSMPTKWTMESLPIPNNKDVKLIEIGSEKRVAVRFIGPQSQDGIDFASNKIGTYLKAQGLKAASRIIIAGYDGPNVPAQYRRWEVMQIVE